MSNSVLPPEKPALLGATCKVSPDPQTISSSTWSSKRPGSLPLTPHLSPYAPSYPLQVCLHMSGFSTCRLLHLSWPKRCFSSLTQPALSDETAFASLQQEGPEREKCTPDRHQALQTSCGRNGTYGGQSLALGVFFDRSLPYMCR